MTPELIARHDRRVPRYTSCPTAPHFKPEVDLSIYAKWLSELLLYLHVPSARNFVSMAGATQQLPAQTAKVAA